MRAAKETKYLEFLNMEAGNAVNAIAAEVSKIGGDEHKIRSIILDLHFGIEFEFRRILFDLLKVTILYETEAELERKNEKLIDRIGRVPIGTIMNMLEATVADGPWPDLRSAKALTSTRNKLAHEPDHSKVLYKGRCPFSDMDCLAQMYVDALGMREVFSRLHWRVVEEPQWHLLYFRAAYEEYKKRYGDIDFKIDGKRPIWS